MIQACSHQPVPSLAPSTSMHNTATTCRQRPMLTPSTTQQLNEKRGGEERRGGRDSSLTVLHRWSEDGQCVAAVDLGAGRRVCEVRGGVSVRYAAVWVCGVLQCDDHDCDVVKASPVQRLLDERLGCK